MGTMFRSKTTSLREDLEEELKRFLESNPNLQEEQNRISARMRSTSDDDLPVETLAARSCLADNESQFKIYRANSIEEFMDAGLFSKEAIEENKKIFSVLWIKSDQAYTDGCPLRGSYLSGHVLREAIASGSEKMKSALSAIKIENE